MTYDSIVSGSQDNFTICAPMAAWLSAQSSCAHDQCGPAAGAPNGQIRVDKAPSPREAVECPIIIDQRHVGGRWWRCGKRQRYFR